MPRVYPEDAPSIADDKKESKNRASCSELREDFKLCMLNTDCVGKQKRTVKDCFDAGDVPIECVQLRTLLFECKRSLLDNRLRFRGRRDY